MHIALRMLSLGLTVCRKWKTEIIAYRELKTPVKNNVLCSILRLMYTIVKTV